MSAEPDARSLDVALLHHVFWPEVQRGSERIINDLATDLLDLGDRPRVITSHTARPRVSREYGYPVLRAWRAPERPAARLGIEPHLSHVPFSYVALRRAAPDVAHAFHSSDALAAVRWAQRTGRPSVYSYMGIPQAEGPASYRFRARILERVTTRSNAVVVLSQAAREEMRRLLGVEARVIHPGVSLTRFTPGGERAPEPTIACAAAPDDPRKRIDLLVRAFSRLRRDRPTARLLLVRPADPGSSHDLREVPGVELFEPDPQGVRDVFRRAWASGLASYKEAFGLVLVESLACGTPVFGARDGGPAEIIDRPEIGRLFDPDTDADGLARVMLETLEVAAAEGTSESCRSRATQFSTVSGAQAHDALYRELLELPESPSDLWAGTAPWKNWS